MYNNMLETFAVYIIVKKKVRKLHLLELNYGPAFLIMKTVEFGIRIKNIDSGHLESFITN